MTVKAKIKHLKSGTVFNEGYPVPQNSQNLLGKSYSRVYRAIATRRKIGAGARGHQEN